MKVGLRAEVLILGPCPDQQDAHCTGLTVDGPADSAPGDYTLTAGGVDDTGDLLTYDFFVDGPEPRDPAPQLANTLALRLGIGTWDVSVQVDDSTRCPDNAEDAFCTEQIVVVGDPENLAPQGVLASFWEQSGAYLILILVIALPLLVLILPARARSTVLRDESL